MSSTLRVLNLARNKLEGQILDTFPTSSALRFLDLNENFLEGAIPKSLRHNTNLTLAKLESFMLDGDEAGSKSGRLSFDIYDNINPMGRSYQDSVTIVNKGRQVKLVKILNAFTSLDFSSNHFEGPIPEELVSFKALHALNLSQNAFSGHITSSIGNLKYLESLDLSVNSFSGNVPTELASLSFLSVRKLSFDHLKGPIPIGTQIQSFEADSFEGNNEGLCGPPLTQNCNFGAVPVLASPPSYDNSNQNSETSNID
ncbi:receptor-like protein 33 [Neltuma alba]|uniref:receptor-like protein 33 n=1 Tax=Neltuma alba TaxID=207710 RepID=UPI0010A4809E|nr:receptor-like protein 33 [Prosopis alba]